MVRSNLARFSLTVCQFKLMTMVVQSKASKPMTQNIISNTFLGFMAGSGRRWSGLMRTVPR